MTTKVVKKAIWPGTTKTLAPYSPGLLVNGTLFISGQLGMEPGTTNLVPGGVKEQTKKALENMTTILKEAGCTMKNVVKTTIYLKDMNDFAACNEVYATFFEDPFPARACFQVAKLPLDAIVEIEGIAKVGDVSAE